MLAKPVARIKVFVGGYLASKGSLLLIGLMVMVVFLFLEYVAAERQINLAKEAHHDACSLMELMLKSSSELEHQVLAYNLTGDPVHIKNFERVLSVRRGNTARPVKWDDIVDPWGLRQESKSLPTEGIKISATNLLAARTGVFEKSEIEFLFTILRQGDMLADQILERLKSDYKHGRKINRVIGLTTNMLMSKEALRASITKIAAATDIRTEAKITQAATYAMNVRHLLIVNVFLLMTLLIRAYWRASHLLGGTAEEVSSYIHLIEDDLGVDHKEKHHAEDSVLSQLSVHRKKLVDIQEANRELQISNAIDAVVFESEQPVAIFNKDGLITKANKAFYCAYGNKDVIDLTLRQIMYVSNADSMAQCEHEERVMWDTLRRTGRWDGEITTTKVDGHMRHDRMSINQIEQNVGTYVAILFDVSESHRLQDKLVQLADYDVLTGVANCHQLYRRLEETLDAARNENAEGALIFIDLDGFKNLNDTRGHAVGDSLLQETARRLIKIQKQNKDMVVLARIGGDDFVMVISGLSKIRAEQDQQLEAITKSIIGTINTPYDLMNGVYMNACSMGRAFFTEASFDRETLLRHADIAMYKSKNTGGNRATNFDIQMLHDLQERKEIASGVQSDAFKNQLRVHYQAKVNQMEELVGVEALLRWEHPVRGLLLPDVFIGKAERLGAINTIGLFVLDTACAQLEVWGMDERTSDLTISINVSAIQLRRDNFIQEVQAAIAQYPISSNQLIFEITESVLIENTEIVVSTLRKLQKLGLRISLDDFGTGYSSLSYLQMFAIDEIKIDRLFVCDVMKEDGVGLVVRTIIGMAKALGATTVAEGVETREQFTRLKGEGCTLFQGYLFGRPVPIEQFDYMRS